MFFGFLIFIGGLFLFLWGAHSFGLLVAIGPASASKTPDTKATP
jgi:hypothetical protein